MVLQKLSLWLFDVTSVISDNTKNLKRIARDTLLSIKFGYEVLHTTAFENFTSPNLFRNVKLVLFITENFSKIKKLRFRNSENCVRHEQSIFQSLKTVFGYLLIHFCKHKLPKFRRKMTPNFAFDIWIVLARVKVNVLINILYEKRHIKHCMNSIFRCFLSVIFDTTLRNLSINVQVKLIRLLQKLLVRLFKI